ncbi:unnamed protein product [Soboliphyme baturini]|uniref:Uncharacterized protein n=1 Tax=Soboliphyme baturini TaxID=241478 RepID=A0A183IDH6_9BILA|nr:unnamed protein product [Soboliphyme baturini]
MDTDGSYPRTWRTIGVSASDPNAVDNCPVATVRDRSVIGRKSELEAKRTAGKRLSVRLRRVKGRSLTTGYLHRRDSDRLPSDTEPDRESLPSERRRQRRNAAAVVVVVVAIACHTDTKALLIHGQNTLRKKSPSDVGQKAIRAPPDHRRTLQPLAPKVSEASPASTRQNKLPGCRPTDHPTDRPTDDRPRSQSGQPPPILSRNIKHNRLLRLDHPSTDNITKANREIARFRSPSFGPPSFQPPLILSPVNNQCLH